jgi:prepilin-type N-terminal cleavage/methylation domain-containing protein
MMLRSPNSRAADDAGFSLVELLVVILVVGALAAIAVPLFLNHAAKANDAVAKSQLNVAATTMQACAENHDGSYASCTLTAIKADEPSLSDSEAAALAASGQSQTDYTLTSSVVATGDVFTLAENNGVETRTCSLAQTAPGSGRCSSGTW